MISRITSGGQNGADLGALLGARDRNTPTGGTMPRGFLTLDGPRPSYASLYGMVEHTSATYPPRTFANVAAADITIRIALDMESAGERLTLTACKKLGKPVADIPVRRHGTGYIFAEQDVFDAVNAIEREARRLGRDVVVNVAGNSERTAPGIGCMARGIVKMILDGACGGPWPEAVAETNKGESQ